MPQHYFETGIKKIAKSLSKVQTDHKKDISRSRILKKIALSCVGLGMLNYVMSRVWPALSLGLFVWFCLSLLFYWLGENATKEYISHYKKAVINQVLRLVIPNLEYKPNQGMESSVLFNKSGKTPQLSTYGSGIFSFSKSSYSTQDYIIAQLRDWKFEAAEINASFKKGRKERTAFKGTAIKITLPVTFSYDLIIQSKDLKKKAPYGSEVHLEGMEWNQAFLTYCDDQVFARYILNPAIMVRILNLYKKFPSLGISFKQNNIYILWNNGRNMFEPEIKILDQSEIEIHVELRIEEWLSLLSLVEELQMGREIWSKKQFLSHLEGGL